MAKNRDEPVVTAADNEISIVQYIIRAVINLSEKLEAAKCKGIAVDEAQVEEFVKMERAQLELAYNNWYKEYADFL